MDGINASRSPVAGDPAKDFWDADAETYDLNPAHRLVAPASAAIWSGVMARFLPDTPSRVLDCGAGTGFLSLIAARQGHEVTATDLSGEMLAVLRSKAAEEKLDIETLECPADQPPYGPFDVVMERHVLWVVPDIAATLRSLRSVCPSGQLIAIESVWGAADPMQELIGKARHLLKRELRRLPGRESYVPQTERRLPADSGLHPSRLVEELLGSGWRDPRLERLRDVEWGQVLEISMPERLLGVSPWYTVTAT